jgi:DNA-binding transcriptional ArsR family regulator
MGALGESAGSSSPKNLHQEGSKKHGSATINVSPHMVKAVLLDLAQWDHEDAEVYKGIANIAHATELPPRSVSQALKVLTEAGILTRKSRGMGKPKLSVLNWSLIESLQQPFAETFSEGAGGATQDPDDQPFTKELPDDGSSSAAKALLELKFVGEMLAPKDADRVAEGLSKKHGEEALLHAIAELPDKTLALASKSDNPAGYLRACLDNALATKSSTGAVNSSDGAQSSSRKPYKPKEPKTSRLTNPGLNDPYFDDMVALFSE